MNPRRIPAVSARFVCPRRARGFTLVELLVVIAIIGVLVGLLMPAVQFAREAARKTQCLNNVKQLSHACTIHATTNQHLPTGGWGWGWAGDPNRGFDKKQPGGWHFNILPYLEQSSVYELGKRQPDPVRRADGKEAAETAVAAFCCPSRRKPIASTYNHSSPFYNIDVPSVMGRSDYAACAGDMPGDTNWKGPLTLADGDAMSDAAWKALPGGENDATGVIFRRSMLLPTDIPGGASNTYLLGERYLNPSHYLNGSSCNDQGWDMGYDYDTNRWTYPDEDHRPRRDTLGYTNCYAFGSVHDGVFHMAMCDGSTHAVSYDVDLDVHRSQGNRKD